MKIALMVLALALCSVANPDDVHAQRAMHRVRLGETLASIAKSYYGDKSHAKILELFNGKRPTVGRYIRIPTAWRYRVSRKRTRLRTLARELLGDARRAPVLVAFNPQLKKRIKRGTLVTVPFTISHVVRSGDSYQKLARSFYGDVRMARLISQYNLSRGTAPSSGSTIEIPIGHVAITAGRLLQLTNQRLLGVQTRGTRQERQALRAANALLRRAEFWRVPLALIRLLGRRIPADSHIAEVYKLLAIAYVALDRSALAVESFKEALRRQPSLRLNPVSDSPKVIKAFLAAQQAKSGS